MNVSKPTGPEIGQIWQGPTSGACQQIVDIEVSGKRVAVTPPKEPGIFSGGVINIPWDELRQWNYVGIAIVKTHVAVFKKKIETEKRDSTYNYFSTFDDQTWDGIFPVEVTTEGQRYVVTSKDDPSVRAIGLTEEDALKHFGRALGEALDLEKLRIRNIIEYRMVGDEAQVNRQRLVSRWQYVEGLTGKTGIKVEPLAVKQPPAN